MNPYVILGFQRKINVLLSHRAEFHVPSFPRQFNCYPKLHVTMHLYDKIQRLFHLKQIRSMRR
jgi:hypothetical protein